MIAVDLDGTLLDDQGELSERNQKALDLAREHGIAVVAVTARPPRAVETVEGLGERLDGALCLNGAIDYDIETGVIGEVRAIPEPLARRVWTELSARIPGATCAIDTGRETVSQSIHFAELDFGDSGWRYVDHAEEVFAQADPIAVFSVCDRDAGAAALRQAAEAVDLTGMAMWSWGSFPLLDFNLAGIDKGRALRDWCERRGIGHGSVFAFGDMPADASMLAWSGSSYAMANAKPEAIAAAMHRTASNNDDGVAEVLERLLTW